MHYGPYELEDLRNIAKTDLWQFDSRPNGKARRRIPKIYLECLCSWGTQGHMLGSTIEPIERVTYPLMSKLYKQICAIASIQMKRDEERVLFVTAVYTAYICSSILLVWRTSNKKAKGVLNKKKIYYIHGTYYRNLYFK